MEDKKWYDLYKQVLTPDKARIAKLVIEQRGSERTAAEYAAAIDMTPAMMSRIMKGNYAKPLTVDVLVKLSEGNEDLLKELLRANGMLDRETQERRQTNDQMRARRMEHFDRERNVMNVLSSELFSRGVAMRRLPMLRETSELLNKDAPVFFSQGMPLRFVIEIQEESPYLWNFMFMLASVEPDDSDEDIDRRVRFFIDRHSNLFLRDAWEPESLNSVKISFVFCDQIFYKAFLSIMAYAKLKNQMTAVLVDLSEGKVIDEQSLTPEPLESPFLRQSFDDEPAEGRDGYFYFYFNENKEDTE